jgi:hypothetical protein
MSAGRRGRYIVVGALVCFLTLVCLPSAFGDEPAEAPVFLKAFGPDGSEASNFQTAGPTAVDQATHEIYVADKETGALYKFSSDGEPTEFEGSEPYISDHEISGLSLHPGPWTDQIAVDPTTHVVYVTSANAVRAFTAEGEPAVFTAGPGTGTSDLGGFTELAGVALDSSGNIYASDIGGVVKIYSRTGEFITQFETESPSLLAVAPDGGVYAIRYGGSLFKFTPSEFPVTSTTSYSSAEVPLADGGFALALAVDPVNGNLYVTEEYLSDAGGVTRISRYDSSGTFILSFAGPGEEGDLQGADFGLAVDGTSKFVYASTNDNTDTGTFSKVEIFGPEAIVVGPPTIVATSVSDVTSGTATLKASINPNTSETTYVFEYGLSDCGGLGAACSVVPAAPVHIGSGHKAVALSQAISGLAPNTTYHYRVVATNEFDAEAGPDRVFETQGDDLQFSLPDQRVWEMVSPRNKFGGTLVTTSKGIVQAAADGNGLAYQSLNSIEADPEGSRAIEAAPVLARRTGDVWRSKDLSPRRTRATNIANTAEFNLFSTDLSKALLEPRDGTPLSEAASERTPYLRVNSEPPAYTPLVTSKEGFANVPPGTEFGGKEPSGATSRVSVSGANASLTHVVVESEVPLAEGADPFSLYEWRAGQLLPVSVRPDAEGGGIRQGTLGSGLVSVRNAISADGSLVFWGSGNVGTGGINLSAIYARDTETEETDRLDLEQTGATGSGVPAPAFQGASADGGVVYFTDSQALTADASNSGRDLYRCEIGRRPGCATLVDVSAPVDKSVESADVEGVAPAISEDGERIYFVARGVLTEEVNEQEEAAVPGEPNLYLWEEGEGPIFIATLSEGDDRDWGKVNGSTPGYAQNLSAAASPSGRYFAFVSELDLTGNGNGSAAGPAEQLFRYDAANGDLVCVSCDPTGAESSGQVSPPRSVDLQGVWAGRRIASLLPEMMLSGGPQVQPYPLHAPRVVLDNGRVFFHAFDPLVPADSNGNWDLYEYEPTGIGDCTATSKGTAIAGADRACVSLLSAGTSEGVSTFLDASTSGDDVFFLTKDRLSPLDEDDVNDVYDARVDGIAATLEPQVECSGASCQAPSPSPDAQSAASESFRGLGNLHQKPKKRCPKGKRKVRRGGKVRCVPRGHHKHNGSSKHRHRHHGGAG